MKGKEEASERMLIQIEASPLSDTQFKAMVIRKFNELTENFQGGSSEHNYTCWRRKPTKKEPPTDNNRRR